MAMSYPYSSFYLEAQWSKRKVAEHFHAGGESQATPLPGVWTFSCDRRAVFAEAMAPLVLW